MSKPWPPPPDSESIQELVATADIEGFIAEGSPADEYEIEAEEIFNAIADWSTAQLTAARLEPVITEIWGRAFALAPAVLETRQRKIFSLAQQIERFFGPEARPLVRGEQRDA